MFVISRILSHETLDVVIWQTEGHRPLKDCRALGFPQDGEESADICIAEDMY